MKQANSAPSTAVLTSASSSTMFGPLPPSSSVIFLTFSDARRMTSRPTAVEPVKATLRTSGWAASRAPTSVPSPVTTLRTPGGNPHSSPIRASSRRVSGVFSSGLITQVFPAASAGPSFQTARSSGKFQGTIPAHTPSGSRLIVPSASVG